METISQYLAHHQWAYTLAVVVGLFIVYFIFKQLMKMALLFTLILLAIGGYIYVKDPQKASESIRQTAKEAKEKTGKMLDTSKNVYRDAKQLYNEGKNFPGEINRLIGGKEQAKKEPSKRE
jgi:hypothetical protein